MPRTNKNQLELPFSRSGPTLWASVDTLNDRSLRIHRERKKIVRRKLRQPGLLDAPEPEADSEDD